MHGVWGWELSLWQLDAIKPIYEGREFEETQQKNSNILSYRRSMSVRP